MSSSQSHSGSSSSQPGVIEVSDPATDRFSQSWAATLARQFAPQERTLPRLLQRQVDRYADRPLIIISGATLTYRQALDLAARSASALANAGVAPGDRVALMCGNRLEFLAVYLGCAWLGAIAVPINIASRGVQLAYILRNSGARLLVIETELTPSIQSLTDSDLPLKDIWLIGDAAPAGLDHYAVQPMPESNNRRAPHPANAGDTVAILYTSGTTGPSKGVCCPQAQFFWWGVLTAERLDIREDDVLLTSLPLFHTNALNACYQALLTGSALVVEKRFSASGFTTSLKHHKATVTYLLGGMVPILLSREPSPADRDHRTRIALGPGVPAQFHEAFVSRFGFGLIDGYGSTETNFVIGEPLDRKRPGQMGRVHPGFHARVVDFGRQRNGGWPGWRTAVAAGRTVCFCHRLFQRAGKDGRGVAQSLVPHRGPRRSRSRWSFQVSRSVERCDPPARGKHLVFRGGAGDSEPRGGVECCRLSGRFRACRRRGDGRDRFARRRGAAVRKACSIIASPACLILRCHVLSNSCANCRPPKMARSRSSSCANVASPRQLGTGMRLGTKSYDER